LNLLRLLPLLVWPALLPAQVTFIAFDAPTGVAANQFISNPLGLDFNVNTSIKITALGVFDSGQDGLAFSQVVRIYNRATEASVADVTIPAGASATLNGGSRFVTLTTPLVLPAGFLGSVVAEINTTDGNWNSHGGSGVSVLNTGGGAISYVGVGRVSDSGPAVYPSRLDGGPANRYLAGSFIFSVIPEPAEWMLLASGLAVLLVWARRRTGARAET
jgi:hypothetical protein